jgi:16S rRNA (cytosine1402-N4)-methyltransferase
VLFVEVMGNLGVRPGGCYCDATVGLGGHAEGILERSSPDGRLIGLDRDQEALALAEERLQRFGSRVQLARVELSDAPSALERMGAPPLDGLLVDLGVSSLQLEEAERGFGFRQPGLLDMRMDRSQGETCAELLARLDEDRLAEVLRQLGEERHGRRIAAAIKAALARGGLETTADLARVVARAMPCSGREHRLDPATRTFQALRIAVNDELGQLRRFLERFPSRLREGGRVAIIAFHSLEDRLVKQRLRALCAGPTGPGEPPALFWPVTRRPIRPGHEELGRNRRARSARLRVAERCREVPCPS